MLTAENRINQLNEFNTLNTEPVVKMIFNDLDELLIGCGRSGISDYNLTTETWTSHLNLQTSQIGLIDFINCSNGNLVSIWDDGSVRSTDLRESNQRPLFKISPVMGVPSSLSLSTISDNQLWMHTHQGYFTRIDIRMNLMCEIFRLQRDKTSLPIISLTNLPNKEISSEELIFLTYPSN